MPEVNGFRDKSPAPGLEVRGVLVSMQVVCLCKNILFIPYLLGMKLNTTCGKCKRVIGINGIGIDCQQGHVNLEVNVQTPAIVMPEGSDIANFGR